MLTLEERVKIVNEYSGSVKEHFPDTGCYNVLIFGSFLTGRYEEDSDIDIGIFSLCPGLTFRIYTFTKDYFDRLGIENDVVRMRLTPAQYINLTIVTGHTYAVTGYCPEELICYLKEMEERYGANPQETVVKRMREEGCDGSLCGRA